MRILGINVENPIPIKATIYKCPYCAKKFIRKNSYYNHIVQKYCYNFNINFYRKKDEYDSKKLQKKNTIYGYMKMIA